MLYKAQIKIIFTGCRSQIPIKGEQKKTAHQLPERITAVYFYDAEQLSVSKLLTKRRFPQKTAFAIKAAIDETI